MCPGTDLNLEARQGDLGQHFEQIVLDVLWVIAILVWIRITLEPSANFKAKEDCSKFFIADHCSKSL